MQGFKEGYFSFSIQIYKKMTNKLKTAIVFFPDKKTVWKLRNVGSVERFLQYGRKIGAEYCNFYDKETRLFIGQMYF